MSNKVRDNIINKVNEITLSLPVYKYQSRRKPNEVIGKLIVYDCGSNVAMNFIDKNFCVLKSDINLIVKVFGDK